MIKTEFTMTLLLKSVTTVGFCHQRLPEMVPGRTLYQPVADVFHLLTLAFPAYSLLPVHSLPPSNLYLIMKWCCSPSQLHQHSFTFSITSAHVYIYIPTHPAQFPPQECVHIYTYALLPIMCCSQLHVVY